MMELDLTLRDNVVWVDRNCLIHTVFHGDQEPDKLRETFAQITELCHKVMVDGAPILLLWDIRDVTAFPVASRFLALRARNNLPYWRLAIVTSNDKHHLATSISKRLTAMSGRKKQIDYFTSLPQAYMWLDVLSRRFKSQEDEWPTLLD